MNPDWPLVALALWDVVPVVLSATGFVVLARLAAGLDPLAGRLGWIATVLVAGAGLSKNILKSAQALTSGGFSAPFLDNALFWLLAPGFLVAWDALGRAVQVDRGTVPRRTWSLAGSATVVLIAGVLAVAVDGRAWFFALLTVATAANAWVVVILVRWARLRNERAAGLLFAVNLVLVVGLSGAAAALPQTLAAQWLQQTVAAGAQGAFMWGAFRLSRTTPA